MTSGRQLSTYSYRDFVPADGMACPICSTPCASLDALNFHLDTVHNEEDTKGALMSWLRQAQKKVQTTLQGSKSPNGSTSTNGAVERSLKQWMDPAVLNGFQQLNFNGTSPDFFASNQERHNDVTREHWQRETGYDVCHVPGCHRPIGRTGRNCSSCGYLFCESHVQYEMKLDYDAQHDPVDGTWCKVCIGCFIGREGYLDDYGNTRNRSDEFLVRRTKTIDRVHLESNRLEKRLEKLARVHHLADKKNSVDQGSTSPSASLSSSLSPDRSESTSSCGSVGSGWSSKSTVATSHNSILSLKLKYREGELAVTKWDDDRSSVQCPLCGSAFSLTNRKHHCRLCGRVVCGRTRCSSMIPLFLDMSSDTFDEEPVGDTRACRDCQRSVFRRKMQREEAMRPLPIFQLYGQLVRARQVIDQQLPIFHEMMMQLEKHKVRRGQEAYERAAQTRKVLLDNFALFDAFTKRIKLLPMRTTSMKRLQDNICTAAHLYLQQHMLPLQMLPRILTPAKANPSTKALPSLPEQNELQTQLDAYTEQYALVANFIKEAKDNRKYDDVKTLTASLEELRSEIDRLQEALRRFS